LDLVGSDPDSRLFQEVRERLGLGYDVSASLDWGADWAVATVSASAGRAALQRLQRAVTDVCTQAAQHGFTADELMRARKKLRYRYASLAESRLERALALAEGTLSGFPLPEVAERIVGSMPKAEVEEAWRRVVRGHALTALLQ
jgi:predicted Zn-dependent peptidase